MAVEPKTAYVPEPLYAWLSERNLDEIYAVHQAAIRTVGRPDLIKPESREFFTRMLTDEGAIVGAFRDSSMIGYGVLQLILPPSENARPYFGLADSDSLAKLAGASVLPNEWGSGVHNTLIDHRIAEAARRGIVHLYSTSAPGNARSWRNLLEAGFTIRGLIEKYGGHLRYLLYRDLSAETPREFDGVWCDAADIDAQRQNLVKGLVGSRWRRQAGICEIYYRRHA